MQNVDQCLTWRLSNLAGTAIVSFSLLARQMRWCVFSGALQGRHGHFRHLHTFSRSFCHTGGWFCVRIGQQPLERSSIPCDHPVALSRKKPLRRCSQDQNVCSEGHVQMSRQRAHFFWEAASCSPGHSGLGTSRPPAGRSAASAPQRPQRPDQGRRSSSVRRRLRRRRRAAGTAGPLPRALARLPSLDSPSSQKSPPAGAARAGPARRTATSSTPPPGRAQRMHGPEASPRVRCERTAQHQKSLRCAWPRPAAGPRGRGGPGVPRPGTGGGAAEGGGGGGGRRGARQWRPGARPAASGVAGAQSPRCELAQGYYTSNDSSLPLIAAFHW